MQDTRPMLIKRLSSWSLTPVSSSFAIVPHFLCAEYRNEKHIFTVHALFKYRPQFVNQSYMMTVIIVGS